MISFDEAIEVIRSVAQPRGAARWGPARIGRTRLTDEFASMRATAAEAIDQADIVVVIGGASVGDKDFGEAMFKPLGLEPLFSKVAIKPGKPEWLGRAGDTLIVGLPGNPKSALVTARLFFAPLLAGMRGQAIDAALRWRTVNLASDLGRCGARETFHRAHFNGETAAILTNQDSSAQRPLADADLLVRQPPNSAAIRPVATVQALDF